MTTFMVWAALPNVAGRQGEPDWYRLVSRVLGLTAAVGFIAAGVSTQVDSSHKGLTQRLFLAVVFAWYAATAVASATSGQPRGTNSRTTPSDV